MPRSRDPSTTVRPGSTGPGWLDRDWGARDADSGRLGRRFLEFGPGRRFAGEGPGNDALERISAGRHIEAQRQERVRTGLDLVCRGVGEFQGRLDVARALIRPVGEHSRWGDVPYPERPAAPHDATTDRSLRQGDRSLF